MPELPKVSEYGEEAHIDPSSFYVDPEVIARSQSSLRHVSERSPKGDSAILPAPFYGFCTEDSQRRGSKGSKKHAYA